MAHDPADALKLAKENLRARKFNAAIEILRNAIEEDKKNASLHECLGSAFYLSGDLDEALTAFQQVAAIKPMKSSAWVNIGAVFNRLGKHHDAVRVLRKAVQRDRRNAQAYYNLGIAQKGLQQLAMAATAYKDALKINPDLAEAHQNLGNVYLDMNNHRQAINSFKRALVLRPNFERARKGLAIAENAVASTKADANPFGRLVSKEELSAQKARSTFKELSDEERVEDRQRIRSHTGVVRENTNVLVEILRDELEPALHQLGRAVSEGEESRDLAGAFESFKEAREKAIAIHCEMKKEMAQLRKHDEQIRG